MADPPSMGYCAKCQLVTPWLANHFANKHNLTNRSEEENKSHRKKLAKESRSMTRRLTDHIAVSESSIRNFFRDKAHSMNNIFELVQRLGHVVIPRGREHSDSRTGGRIDVPKEKPSHATDFSHPANKAAPPTAEENEEEEDDEEEEEEQAGEEGFEEEEQDDPDYDDDDEDSGDEDDETEQHWRYLGQKYRDESNPRFKLQESDMYAAYNMKHASNHVLQDWFEYETTYRTRPPTDKQKKAAYFNQKKTRLNHVAAFLFYSATDKLSKTLEVPLLSHKIICRRTSIAPWLKCLRDLGIQSSNLKTRAQNVIEFYQWYKTMYQTSAKHDQEIRGIIEAAQKAKKDISGSVVSVQTKKQKAILSQEDMKTVQEVMSYKTKDRYIEKMANLKALLNTEAFQQQLRNTQGSLRLKRNKEVREHFKFLVGSICAVACLEQCQRPSVIYNVTVTEMRLAMSQRKPPGTEENQEALDKVVFVFRHKTSYSEGKQPAAFTIRPEEEWMFKGYNDYFRPLVAHGDDDPETQWLLNTNGMSYLNMVPDLLADWQTKIYAGSEDQRVTISEARTAIQTLVRSDESTQSKIKAVNKTLKHTESVADLWYNMPTVRDVIQMCDTVRGLLWRAAEGEVEVPPQPEQNEVPEQVAEERTHEPVTEEVLEHTAVERERKVTDEVTDDATERKKRKGNYRGSKEKKHEEFDFDRYLPLHPINWREPLPSSTTIKEYFKPGYDSGPSPLRSMRDFIKNKTHQLFAKEVVLKGFVNPNNIYASCAACGPEFWAKKNGSPGVQAEIAAWVVEFMENPELMDKLPDPLRNIPHSPSPIPAPIPQQMPEASGVTNAVHSSKSLDQQETLCDDNDGNDGNDVEPPPKKRTRLAAAKDGQQPVVPWKVAMSEQEILKLVNSQNWPHVELGDAGKYGKGVFVNKDVEAGTVLCNYHGRTIPTRKLDAYLKKHADETQRIEEYFQKLDDNTTILAHYEDQRGFGHMINHSPHPRCWNTLETLMKPKTKQGEKPVIVFKASRNLKKGEELLRNYGSGYEWHGVKPSCPVHEP